ncbi:MAG TPA: polysaccharide biosynthesis tyrosine autokinase [Acidobacteriaceae bacterium]
MDPQKIAAPTSGGVIDPIRNGDGQATTDATLSEILLTVRKRKAVIIIALLLGIAYGLYKGATQPRIYDAYGTIEIRSGAANQYRVNSANALGGDASSQMPTEVAILQSDTLLYTVAKELNLANNRDFLGIKGNGPVAPRSLDDPNVREAVLGRLRSSMTVFPVPKTDIIRINYGSFNARLSADIVNTVIDAYIKHTYNARFESSQRLSEFLSRQLSGLKQEVETSQQRMLELGRPLGVLGFDANHNEITSNLDDLTKAAASAEIARILAESRYKVLSSASPDSLSSMIDATPGSSPNGLSSLRSQLAAAQASYAQSMGYFGPNNPQAKAARAQIDEIQRAVDKEQSRLVEQAHQEYIASLANEKQTTAALEGEKSDAYKLRDDLVQYTLKQRDFEANRTLYEGLLERIRTAGVQAGLESQEIDIVDQAYPPVSPTLEARSSLLTLYTAIGLVFGIIFAFVLESLDTGLRSIAEIEAVTGLASLALIPRDRKSSADAATQTSLQRSISVLANPKSQFAESFRALRTSLLLSSAGHPPITILLTSATPSEGKTTISTNLACVLAQRDVRVLLIDADLRRPTVHHRFGLNGRIGLTTVLTGASSVEDAIQHVPDIPNLDILASGPVPPFPTEMLGSSTMTALLEKLKTVYTHIVIDSPPLLSVTDGVVLARESDAVVLIVRHGKSSRHVVRRARDLLLRAGAPLTGIALNAVDLNSPEYYGYYGYSGYSYAGVDTSSWKSKSGKSTEGDSE